jgi:ketosteroid isomerase-like protein
MKEQENVQVVQQMFEAFGRRDLPGALNTLSNDVYWQSPVTKAESKEISWSKPRHSREEVALFFKELFEKVQPERLEPLEFTAQGDRVVVEGKNRGIVNSTGHPYEHDWVMVFTLQEGKIKRLLHYYDTVDIMAAFRSK